nr:hypothetical protein BaRGS_028301 [Batillaria attramentaria]
MARELQKAAEILQTHVKEQECRVPPGNSDLMQSSEFHTLAESLKSKYRGKLLFTVTDGGQKIAITATNDVIESASEQVDVLVSSVRPDLKLDTGEISKSVFRAAGQGIQDEVNANNPQGATVWTSVYTQGHNLQCGQVCHMVLGKWGHGAEELFANSWS